MQIGLVGKPSAGKSTFFKAATLADVDIANFPFTTIKPNSGVAYVKIDCVDKEFDAQCNPREGYCVNHKRFVPVQLIDVAGLVPGAHEGKGMGNQFLSDLNQADVLIHVVDVSGSANEKGEPVAPGSYDPKHDVEFLEKELDMWYLDILKRGWDKLARSMQTQQGKTATMIAKQLSGLRVTEDMAKDAIRDLSDNPSSWTDEQLLHLATTLRKQSKPIIIAANKVDVAGAEEKYQQLKQTFPDYHIIPCSADSELALREANKKELIGYVPGDKTLTMKGDLNDAQQNALQTIQKNVLDKLQHTGVQTTLNTAVFDILKYIAIFPGGANKLEDKDGNVLPDCFLLPNGSTALQFAFRLHTDIGNNFVKAIDVKTKRVVGKEHQLKHRDIVEIMVKK